MTAVSDILAPPERVEVVSAGAIEAGITAITTELASLRREVEELRSEAARLDRQVEQAERRTDDDGSVLAMLKGLFADQARGTRADLEAALALAEERGRRRVAAAHAEADRILADASSVVGASGLEVAAPRAEAGSAAAPSHDGAAAGRFGPLLADTDLEVDDRLAPAGPGVDGARSLQHQWAQAPEPIVDPEPEPAAEAESSPEPPPTPTPIAHPTPTPMAAPEPAAGENPAQFAQFWSADTPAPARRSAPAILDAVLPMIAVLIVVIVILSWVR